MKKIVSVVMVLMPIALYGARRVFNSDLSQYRGGGISACTAIATAAADDILGDAGGLERLGQEELEGFIRHGVEIFRSLGKQQGDPVDVAEVPLRFSTQDSSRVTVGFVGESPFGPEAGVLTRDDIYRTLARLDPACGLYIRQGATYLLCHKHGNWLFADSHAREDGRGGSHMIIFDSDGDFRNFLETDYRFQPVLGADLFANQFALHVLEPRMPIVRPSAESAGPASEYPAQMRDLQNMVTRILDRYNTGRVSALDGVLQIGSRMDELKKLAARVHGDAGIAAVVKRYEQLEEAALKAFLEASEDVTDRLVPEIDKAESFDALQALRRQFPPFLRDKSYYELLGVSSPAGEEFDEAVKSAEARLRARAEAARAPRVHSRSVAEFMQREREIYDAIGSMFTLRELTEAVDYLHEGLRLYDRQLSPAQKRLVAAALSSINDWMAQLMAAGIKE